MWINRAEWIQGLQDRERLRAERDAQRDANKVLQVNLDWMRVRLTQVEMERAQMIHSYTGVTVPSPRFQTKAETQEILDQTPGFADLGDAEAAKLGIDWNPDGTLRYTS